MATPSIQECASLQAFLGTLKQCQYSDEEVRYVGHLLGRTLFGFYSETPCFFDIIIWSGLNHTAAYLFAFTLVSLWSDLLEKRRVNGSLNDINPYRMRVGVLSCLADLPDAIAESWRLLREERTIRTVLVDLYSMHWLELRRTWHKIQQSFGEIYAQLQRHTLVLPPLNCNPTRWTSDMAALNVRDNPGRLKDEFLGWLDYLNRSRFLFQMTMPGLDVDNGLAFGPCGPLVNLYLKSLQHPDLNLLPLPRRFQRLSRRLTHCCLHKIPSRPMRRVGTVRRTFNMAQASVMKTTVRDLLRSKRNNGE